MTRQFYRPAVIETMPNAWVWVGTIPSYLAGRVFETEQEALDAYTSIDPMAELA